MYYFYDTIIPRIYGFDAEGFGKICGYVNPSALNDEFIGCINRWWKQVYDMFQIKWTWISIIINSEICERLQNI